MSRLYHGSVQKQDPDSKSRGLEADGTVYLIMIGQKSSQSATISDSALS